MDRLIVFLKFGEKEKTAINGANIDICLICRKAISQALEGGRNDNQYSG